MHANENLNMKPGVVGLVSDALARSADLLQTEVRLARAEIGEKAMELRDNVVACLAMMLIGAAFLIAALVLLLQAVVAALINGGLAPHWAILIVAGGAAVGGIVLLTAAKKQFGNIDPTPQRTINSLERDARMAKESLT
jgi:uncharacterized membrane protein YqjE